MEEVTSIEKTLGRQGQPGGNQFSVLGSQWPERKQRNNWISRKGIRDSRRNQSRFRARRRHVSADLPVRLFIPNLVATLSRTMKPKEITRLVNAFSAFK